MFKNPPLVPCLHSVTYANIRTQQDYLVRGWASDTIDNVQAKIQEDQHYSVLANWQLEDGHTSCIDSSKTEDDTSSWQMTPLGVRPSDNRWYQGVSSFPQGSQLSFPCPTLVTHNPLTILPIFLFWTSGLKVSLRMQMACQSFNGNGKWTCLCLFLSSVDWVTTTLFLDSSNQHANQFARC
jgi:hypothetical protein